MVSPKRLDMELAVSFLRKQEFRRYVGDMSEETHSYPVTGERNDFCNWVRDLIGDTTLAGNHRKAADRNAMSGAVKARMAKLRITQTGEIVACFHTQLWNQPPPSF